MKRLVLTLLCLWVSLSMFAQDGKPLVQVGVRGGVNFSTMIVSTPKYEPNQQSAPSTYPHALSIFGNTPKFAFKPGFNAGFTVDFNLPKNWSLNLSILYSMQRTQSKGWENRKLGDTIVQVESTESYKMNLLKIPLTARYHLPMANPKNHLVLGAGVYGSVAMSSMAKLHETQRYSTGEQYIVDSELDPYKDGNKYLYRQVNGDDYVSKEHYYYGKMFNRFNFGVTAEIGFEISKFYIGFQVDMDVLNVGRKSFMPQNFEQRALNLQVGIGYWLN